MKRDWDAWNFILMGAILGILAVGIIEVSNTTNRLLMGLVDHTVFLPGLFAFCLGASAWVRNRLNGR